MKNKMVILFGILIASVTVSVVYGQGTAENLTSCTDNIVADDERRLIWRCSDKVYILNDSPRPWITIFDLTNMVTEIKSFN